jgi:type IX secretion system PorP/SprF family membrane protein
MIMNVLRFLMVPISFFLAFLGTAQDVNFSQFYNNGIYYNPAMTAIGNGYTYTVNARNQWTPIPGKFNSFVAAFEGKVIESMGFSVLGFSDAAGDGMLRTQAGYLSYSYRPVETKKFILQFGASGGLVNKSIDWSRMVFSDQLDEVYGKVNATQFISPNFRNILYPDFNAGVAIRFNHRNKINKGFKRAAHTAGFAIHHLNKPKDAFLLDKNYLPMKFVVHYNSNILVNKLIISPGFIYELQNEFQTVTLGMYFAKKPVTLGLWFRNRTFAFSSKSYDAFIVSIGLNLPLQNERYLKLTYSIDFTISKLRTSSFGTNELSLIYNLDNRYILKKSQAKQSKKAMYQCPTDFKGF